MRTDKPRRDENTVSSAFNRHFAQVAGLFELLEAGLPPEHRQNARNARTMVLDSLHQLRQAIDENYHRKQENT